jgi:hypothetical protein
MQYIFLFTEMASNPPQPKSTELELVSAVTAQLKIG